MNSEAASSSSCSRSSSFRWTFDVFVSYRGTDTKNFTGHLINNLRQKGLSVFKDNEFERGDCISPALDSAIEGSRASIVVFSENYADSKWCLNELVKILECRERNQQLVRPIFYKVDPSVVRNQRERYGEALDFLGTRFRDEPEKVRNWRKALSTAANLAGWDFHGAGGYEPDFIQKITAEVSTQIANRAYLYEAEHPVGLRARVSELNSILEIGRDRTDVRFVVIHGPHGIGKTTLAKAVYNSNIHHFEGSSFLANVSENLKQLLGLMQLQKTLLLEILREKDMELGNVDKGITLIKNRLRGKRVLLVLDNVNSLNELYGLAGKSDWFGKGSRIIVTTSEKNLLDLHDSQFTSTFEVKGLDDSEALKLLCWNAFRDETPTNGYVEMADQAVKYAEGFPTKLIELGSWLHGKLENEWIIAMESFRRNQNQKVKVKKLYNDSCFCLVDEESDFPSSSTENPVSMKDYNCLPHTDPCNPPVSMEDYNDYSCDLVDEESDFPSSSTENHFPMENENMLISSNKDGKICCMLSAKELSIEWSHESRYWSWISLPDSRFPTAAKLNKVYYLNIEGKIETTQLSPRTTYAVYFVFKLEAPVSGFQDRAMKFTVSCDGNITFSNFRKHASRLYRQRKDGWMELIMGEFFINDGDDEIKFSLTEHDTSVKKKGLIIEGVDFRPKIISPREQVNLELDSSSSSSIERCSSIIGYAKLIEKDVIISQDTNGKICYMLSARVLKISWSHESKHWSWISLPNSRFSKVAKLIEVYYFNIEGKVASKILSSRTAYEVYFVFRFEGSVSGFKKRDIKMVVNYERGGGEHIVCLDPPKNSPRQNRKRDDGWMKMKMGEMFIHGEQTSEVNFSIMDHDTDVMKSGIIVEGVEFRPK